MKKTTTIAAVCAAALALAAATTASALADEEARWQKRAQTLTLADFEAAANRFVACTDQSERITEFKTNDVFFALRFRRDLVPAAAAIDAKIAASVTALGPEYGADPQLWWHRSYLPKTSAVWWNLPFVATNIPVYKAVNDAAAAAAPGSEPWDDWRNRASFEQCVLRLGEIFTARYIYGPTPDSLASTRELIQTKAAPVVRRWIRRNGGSFVTDKDGKNPMEEHLKPLTAALNAPRFKGLNVWLEKHGVAARFDESLLPTEEAAAKLKEDVYYGDVEMTEKTKFLLQVCLGVEGYNAFVKEYNGEK